MGCWGRPSTPLVNLPLRPPLPACPRQTQPLPSQSVPPQSSPLLQQPSSALLCHLCFPLFSHPFSVFPAFIRRRHFPLSSFLYVFHATLSFAHPHALFLSPRLFPSFFFPAFLCLPFPASSTLLCLLFSIHKLWSRSYPSFTFYISPTLSSSFLPLSASPLFVCSPFLPSFSPPMPLRFSFFSPF